MQMHQVNRTRGLPGSTGRVVPAVALRHRDWKRLSRPPLPTNWPPGARDQPKQHRPAAAELLRWGFPGSTMVRLCPLALTEQQLASRMEVLIAVGAVLVSPSDPGGVRRVLASGERDVDVVVGLVDLYAWSGERVSGRDGG